MANKKKSRGTAGRIEQTRRVRAKSFCVSESSSGASGPPSLSTRLNRRKQPLADISEHKFNLDKVKKELFL